MWFAAISGLKITLEKRKLIPLKGANVEELIEVLGCRVGALPTI